MGDVTTADPSFLLEEWKTAFFEIHRKNPRKPDWLNKAPLAVRQAYMSKHGIEPTAISTSARHKKANTTQCIRLKRPAAVELDFPVKRLKLQPVLLSGTAMDNKSDSSHPVMLQLSPVTQPAEVQTPAQSLDTAEETSTDSPTKAALAPFCGVRPVLRRSPRKLPSFGSSFESPQKLTLVVQRKRLSISRRNICQLIDSTDANGQKAGFDLKSDSRETEEPDENVPFEGSEQVADMMPNKPKAKRAAKRPDGNFVRLNMRKKTFVRGHTSATTKRKFWNRRRFMNNRK